MSKESMWWHTRDDQQRGPFSETDFKVLAASGQLRSTDLVWREGFANWVPAASVPNLLPSHAMPPPSPSKPPRGSGNREGSASSPGSSALSGLGGHAMSMTTLFRSIMIGSLVLEVMSVIAGETLSQTLPAPLRQYLATEGVELSQDEAIKMLVIALTLVVPSLIALIVAIVGIWKFKPWARTLYVVLSILTFLVPLALGPVIMNPWENLFMSLAELSGGIVLAMMFLPPIAHEFEKNKIPRG